MNEVIAFCGLNCSSCPIYLACRENDPSIKEKMIGEIIKTCEEKYGIEYKYEDITGCDGCTRFCNKMFSGCKDCHIRKCVLYKEIDGCAYCSEYPCEILSPIFKSEPGAKNRLDLIRSAFLS